jgi:hypothetical protein
VEFIGKFAAVGQGGSGKTRAVASIANYALGKEKYAWVEESNLSGTLTVTPYSFSLPSEDIGSSNKRIIISDNPGQNSLEMVRLAVARSGADYSGIIIFSDALSWNFREVGILHTESIAQYLKTEELPVAFITTKADMIIKFQQTNFLNEVVYVIANTIQEIESNMNVPYFNRVRNKQESFDFYMIDNWLPFTHLEQVIINALDREFLDNKTGFTTMNRRLLARSLLLGYCDYYRKEFPEYIKQYPVFNAIDGNLLNSLNYHRPSAFETETPWKVLAAQSRSMVTTKNEPPFKKDAFDEGTIEYVLRNFCLGTQSRHYELEGKLRARAFENGWKFVSSAYTDSVTKAGIERTVDCVKKLVKEVEKRNINKKEDNELHLHEF